MKWIVACVLAGTTLAAAAPDPFPYRWPAKRKPPIEGYSVESLRKFVDAVIADKAGRPHEAVGDYRRLVDDGHPSTLYNLADALRRVEYYPQAIEFYRKYLAALPDAPDRKEVERIIEQIEKRPPIAVLDGEDPDAVILVDGKLVGPSPAIMMSTPGPHIADRIGPTSYRHQIFSSLVGHTEHVDLKYEAAQGNVILSTAWGIQLQGSWEDSGTTFHLRKRFTLPPGRYETFVKSKTHACNKIAFDVPKGDDLIYVYIDVKPGEDKRFCTPLIATQQTIRLPR